MLKRTLTVCALTLVGSACTTVPQATPFPTAPEKLTVKCGRPKSVADGATAAVMLATVTANYAAHHRCADKDDGLVEWVLEQEKVK